MFTLVSGADEFVNYGSVAAIDEYFREVPEEHQSKELQELLTAMRNFSDAIKICKIDAIEGQLQVMNGKIENFRQKTDKSLQEELFAQIIDTIQHEYGALITKEPSRLDIIEWCANKNFLQQAMTMCTEWVPVMLVDYHICYPIDSSIKEKMGKDKMHHFWQHSFITSYSKSQYKIGQKDILRQQLITIFNKMQQNCNVKKDIADLGINSGKLVTFIDILNSLDTLLRKIRREMVSSGYGNKYPRRFFKIQEHEDYLHLLKYAYYKMPDSYLADFTEYMQNKASKESVLKIICNTKIEEMCDLFKIPLEQKASPTAKGLSKWDIRKMQWQEMFSDKIVRSNYERQYVFHLLELYNNIREQRNNINHVNENGVEELQSIKNLIIDCVRLIQNREKYRTNSASL
jgi:hypothetical protein